MTENLSAINVAFKAVKDSGERQVDWIAAGVHLRGVFFVEGMFDGLLPQHPDHSDITADFYARLKADPFDEGEAAREHNSRVRARRRAQINAFLRT